jgi:hypothetical protein
LAARCPACGGVSANLVSCGHVDVPFHHDREVGVSGRLFPPHVEPSADELEAELRTASFDARRLHLR